MIVVDCDIWFVYSLKIMAGQGTDCDIRAHLDIVIEIVDCGTPRGGMENFRHVVRRWIMLICRKDSDNVLSKGRKDMLVLSRWKVSDWMTVTMQSSDILSRL